VKLVYLNYYDIKVFWFQRGIFDFINLHFNDEKILQIGQKYLKFLLIFNIFEHLVFLLTVFQTNQYFVKPAEFSHYFFKV
jgi:hypothetical protein